MATLYNPEILQDELEIESQIFPYEELATLLVGEDQQRLRPMCEKIRKGKKTRPEGRRSAIDKEKFGNRREFNYLRDMKLSFSSGN